MQRSFTDWVDSLWHAVRDPAALTTLLLELRQLDQHHVPVSPCPAVNTWFSPLLYRRLTSDERCCVLPLPSHHASPTSSLLVASLLRAILLPMRAQKINPDAMMQILDGLEYSLDANSGILAMVSGDAADFESGFSLPPLPPSWTLFPWRVATSLEHHRRPCSLVECLRLLRTDSRSMLQHLVDISSASPPLHLHPEPPSCALCSDAPAVIHPCSRADASHSLCGLCAVQSLRHALSESALRREPVLCPFCKVSHMPPEASDMLSGWFHPSAVDAITSWCSAHADELQKQPDPVPPISHQELRFYRCSLLSTIVSVNSHEHLGFEDVVCECANDSCSMPMILRRPNASTVAAASGIIATAANTAASAAADAVDADADGANNAETWEQYSARLPVYPVHHPCIAGIACSSHDAASTCTVCMRSWASHDSTTHACPVPGGLKGSFATQTDVLVTCQYCNHAMCEACLMPACSNIEIPFISLLGLKRTITIHHAGITCSTYFHKVAAARATARSSSSMLSHVQTANMSPDAVRSMLAASGAKECPSCGMPGTHARGHHCHHINCEACATKYCFVCLEISADHRHHCSNGCPLFCTDECDCVPCSECTVGRSCSQCDKSGSRGCTTCAGETAEAAAARYVASNIAQAAKRASGWCGPRIYKPAAQRRARTAFVSSTPAPGPQAPVAVKDIKATEIAHMLQRLEHPLVHYCEAAAIVRQLSQWLNTFWAHSSDSAAVNFLGIDALALGPSKTVGIVANTKTLAQATASVVAGVGCAVASTASSAFCSSVAGGMTVSGALAPIGIIGVVGGAVVGSVVGAAAGVLVNVPNAYRNVRSGFQSAAGAYSHHEAEYRKERQHVDAALADATRMREFVGPRALAAALARFEFDDDMAVAAASVCNRSLDIIEKVAAAHEGEAGRALLIRCVELLILSGLPLQLFKCFCTRSGYLDVFLTASPRYQLLLQLLCATCRCVHVANEHGVDVPLSMTAGVSQCFSLVRPHDGQLQRASHVDLMSRMLSRASEQPQLEPTATASLLLLSVLLSHCVTSVLQPPDTSAINAVALHVIRHTPLALFAVLTPRNSSPHLPPPLALHACASFLLVLASSSIVTSNAESPTAAAALCFSPALLRFALISYACSIPLPAITSHLYQRVFKLIATSIERLPHGSVSADRLLQSLASDDEGGTCGELIQLYRQHVLKDKATVDVCSAVLLNALEDARNAAIADAAVEMMRRM